MAEKKELRPGYTTGACATAATKGALLALIQQNVIEDVELTLPIGEVAKFEIKKLNFTSIVAHAGVIKDAGDDPDVTDKVMVHAKVSWAEDEDIHIEGGIGVGRVTKPGLPISVGEAAINPVPRRMIKKVVKECLDESDISRGVRVLISVPAGVEIAKTTLNPRLGILGGISILGSRGTVIPYSIADYKASIVVEVKVAKENGDKHLIFTTGSFSEETAEGIFTELSETSFVQMGEYVGFALQHAKRQGFKKVTMVSMIGKLSKIAQGVMMVHSRNKKIDFNFLAKVAGEIGASIDLQLKIKSANTAAHVVEMIEEAKLSLFYTQICHLACVEGLKHIDGGLIIESILLGRDGRILGRVELYD